MAPLLAGCATAQMHASAAGGDVEHLRRLLDRGAPIDAPQLGRITPLSFAAGNGRLEAVKLLLERGANPNWTNPQGLTPLTYGVNGGNLEVVKALVAGGANIRQYDIDSARQRGHHRLVEYLEQTLAGTVLCLINAGQDPHSAAVAPANIALFAASGNPHFSKVREVRGIGEAQNCTVIGRVLDDTAELLRIQFLNTADPRTEIINKTTGGDVKARYNAAAGEARKKVASSELKPNIRLAAEPPLPAPAAPAPAVAQAPVFTPAPAAPAAPAAPRVQAPSSTVAQPGYRLAERPDDFAVVIGIESYSSLPAATHAERDADAVRAHLKALGLPERNIIMLKGSNAGRARLAAYLEEWLPRNVKPTSRVFVYYSGHGAPDPKSGQAYMVPWDGDPMFLQSTAYPLSTLYSNLAKLKAKHVTVALDACFSGAGGRSVLAKGARPLVAKTETAVARKGLTVLAAASGDEITGALDEPGHGMFTYFLLKGLSEGKRSARELHEYLKPRVQDEARRQNREQTPQLIGEDAPL